VINTVNNTVINTVINTVFDTVSNTVFDTVVDTLTISKTATVTEPPVTVTKTIVTTLPNPVATLCPGESEQIFEAERGVYIIVCGQSRPSYDIIPGGTSTDSLLSCADLCDSFNAAGVDCSAAMFEPSTSLCFPQGASTGPIPMTVNESFDVAILNGTIAASKKQRSLKKRNLNLI